MKKNLYYFLFCIIISIELLTLTGCSGGKDEKISRSETCFGTIMTITLYGKQEETESLIDECFAELTRLENIFSARLNTSELSELNKKAYDTEVKVSDELFYVIDKALSYSELTDGAINVCIGNLVDLWGIGTDHEKIPNEDEISALCGISYDDIKLDEENRTVRFLDSKIKLDLGAVAKGYAADAIKELILKRNSSCYGVLNFGGNIMTIGEKPSGDPWNIGITDPRNNGNLCATVSLHGECLVTSGDYERFFEKDGVRYHHILDPDSGYPAKSGVISVSIIGESSLDCDALSTACFILGIDEGLKLINSLDGYEALFIDESGEFYMSSGMDRYDLKPY